MPSTGLLHSAMFSPSISAPYKHLGLQFIPLGGIHLDNARDYLSSDLICAIGGSWIAKRDLILMESWETIRNNASDITRLINEVKSNK